VITPRDPLETEAGLTLVELLITVFVSAVLLGLVATIFVTTLQANAATRDRDLATGRAQAISTSLTTSVRNASAVSVTATAGGGTVVRARVATGSASWECRAWAVVDLQTWDAAGRHAGADGRFEVRAHTYPALSTTAPVPAPAATWGTLAEHAEPARDSTGSPRPYFVQDANRLSWNLTIAAAEEPQLNERSLASVAGSAVARARENGAPIRCW
jgi:Tfp pilus assembly protein PilV